METDKGNPNQDNMFVNLDTHLKNEEAVDDDQRQDHTFIAMKHSFESPRYPRGGEHHPETAFYSAVTSHPQVPHCYEPEVPLIHPVYEEVKEVAVVDMENVEPALILLDNDYQNEFDAADLMITTSKPKRVARNASRQRTSTLQEDSDAHNPRRSKRLESRHHALQMQQTYKDQDDELNNAYSENE